MHMSRQTPPDHELVARAQQGDADAFGVLYDRYVDDVYRFFYYRIFDQQEAEDLTETTFLKAWEHLDRLRAEPGMNFRAWLLRIARNLWIDRHRVAKDVVALDALPSLQDPEDSPERQAQQHEAREWLLRALAQLPERMRDVVVYRFFHGLKPAEIAELMDMSEANVRILQHRALQRMRRWLEAHGVHLHL